MQISFMLISNNTTMKKDKQFVKIKHKNKSNLIYRYTITNSCKSKVKSKNWVCLPENSLKTDFHNCTL